jgi:RNA recognition motif-containing protein
MTTNLYVGNLSFQTTDQDLADLFSQYGEVVAARVIFDRDTNRSRGFGFVEMANQEEAQKAIQALNETEFMSRNIRVNVANSKREGGSRGGRHAWR